MNWILFIALLLWIYVLTVLKRGRLHFGFFAIGSIGLFIFLMMLKPMLTGPLTRFIASASASIGQFLKITQPYVGNSMIMIQGKSEALGMVVDYECSGIIEILAFTSLLWFFPVYQWKEKVGINVVGVIVICIANILRVILISFIVYQWGNDAYYIAHTLIGRLFFYALSAALYFYVFTKAQIIRQKVGSFRYEID